MEKKPWRLGEVLVQKGYITWEQLEEALRDQHQPEAIQLSKSAAEKKKQTAAPVLNLGEILVRYGWIGWDQLDTALRIQNQTGELLGNILIKKGFVTAKDLQRALAVQYNLSFVDFEKINLPEDIIRLVPKHLAHQHKLFPLIKKGDSLLIAISDPKNINPQLALQQAFPDLEILTALATADEIENALLKYYGA